MAVEQHKAAVKPTLSAHLDSNQGPFATVHLELSNNSNTEDVRGPIIGELVQNLKKCYMNRLRNNKFASTSVKKN